MRNFSNLPLAMSCNHCNTKFNFFHKEAGCASCGLSFCNKCIKQKCKIPMKGNSELNVCRTCYNTLTSSGSSTSVPTVITPPEAYLKRIEALEDSARPPITIYKNDSKIPNSGLAPQDIQILERLQRLKDDGGKRQQPPSEAELRQRLAMLKGENNYVEGPSKASIFSKDTRTDTEKADILLEQFVVERDIELAKNPQVEIEARLASLREKGIRPNESSFMKNMHDASSSSEDEVEKITKKIMDEVALDSRCPVTLSSPAEDLDAMNNQELPWCVLCNNDATFRCFDCGGDLYCNECNYEAHRNWDATDHKVVSYQAPQ